MLKIKQIVFDFFWGFKDGVLWFVKVLGLWYLAFGGFAFIRQKYRSLKLSFTVLVIETIVVFIIVCLWMKDFQTMSVPMFAMGVFASILRSRANLSIILVFIMSAILQSIVMLQVYSSSVAIQCCVNYLVLVALVFVFSLNEFTLTKLPSSISSSFDLYLTHNKVLMILKSLMFPIPFVYFVCLTIITTSTFYLIRSKIFKM